MGYHHGSTGLLDAFLALRSPPAAFGLREVAARSDLNPFAENSPWAEPGNPFEEPSNPFSEPEGMVSMQILAVFASMSSDSRPISTLRSPFEPGSEAFEDAVSERGVAETLDRSVRLEPQVCGACFEPKTAPKRRETALQEPVRSCLTSVFAPKPCYFPSNTL